MSTMQQYQAVKQGGPFALVSVPKPTPGPHEVLVRTKAVGLNPVDAKSLHLGIRVDSWPTVLGLEAAGIVDSVGENVTAFKAGDEVFALAMRGPDGVKGAAFQEYFVAPQAMVGEKPRGLSFEEAASLIITWSTAASAIVLGLGIPLPGFGKTELDAAKAPKSILVLGGSSGCGSHAVQLLRLSLGPSATIIFTSSPQHHQFLQTLGASSGIARADQGNVEVLKAASPGADGYDAIIDCVSAADEQPQIFDALRSDGPKLFAKIFTGSQLHVPEGVHSSTIFGTQIFGTDGGTDTFSYITDLFARGNYKLPVKVEVVGEGYDAIAKGIEQLRTGVSGTKLVVSL